MKKLLLASLLIFSTSAFASGQYNQYGWRPTGFLLKQQLDVTQRMNNRQFNEQFLQGGDQRVTFPRGRKPALPIGTVFIPSANPTANCVLTYAGGGGFPFGSIGGAISVVDWDCRRIEAGKYLAYMKNTSDDPKWDRMIMDTTCAAESLSPSRDCKKHLIATAKENAELDKQLANLRNEPLSTSAAAPEDPFQPERKADLGNMVSWLNPFSD